MSTQTPNTSGNTGDNPDRKPLILIRLASGKVMEFEHTSYAVVRAALARRRQGGRGLWLQCPKYPDWYAAIFESAAPEPSAMLPLPLHAPSAKMEKTPDAPPKTAPSSTPLPSAAPPSTPHKPPQPRKKPSEPEIA